MRLFCCFLPAILLSFAVFNLRPSAFRAAIDHYENFFHDMR